jgi:crotonobetainyl-CoA:carnitine CoA-transferase CaiB-like acyl-CoA transferase
LNDYGTGISAAFAVMLALLERKKTGLGQKIEAALSYTSALITGPYHVDYEGFQREDIGGPGAKGTGALNRLYECLDGWLLLSVSGNIELNALKATSYFSGLPENPSCDDLRPIFRQKSADDWETILQKAGVPTVRNASTEELHADPSNRKRHLVCARDYRPVSNTESINKEGFQGDPAWGHTTWAGNSVNMSDSNLVDVQPPLFGADTDDILKEIGLSQDDVMKLRSAGAIPADLPIPLR